MELSRRILASLKKVVGILCGCLKLLNDTREESQIQIEQLHDFNNRMSFIYVAREAAQSDPGRRRRQARNWEKSTLFDQKAREKEQQNVQKQYARRFYSHSNVSSSSKCFFNFHYWQSRTISSASSNLISLSASLSSSIRLWNSRYGHKREQLLSTPMEICSRAARAISSSFHMFFPLLSPLPVLTSTFIAHLINFIHISSALVAEMERRKRLHIVMNHYTASEKSMMQASKKVHSTQSA